MLLWFSVGVIFITALFKDVKATRTWGWGRGICGETTLFGSGGFRIGSVRFGQAVNKT